MTDTEKLALALWALRGGVCWLGTSIKRGPAEHVAVRQLGPYSAVEIIEESFHADPWECLALARKFIESQDSS